MLVPSLDRAGVRKLLDQIPTDADFDAFCLDYFPAVQARFSVGMDRVQKATLLLQLESDYARIAEKLRQHFANRATGAPKQVNPRRRSRLGWVGVGIALLVAAGLLVYRLSGNRPERVAAPTSTPSPSPTPIGSASNPPPLNPPPAGGRLAVEQEGDIHAKGRVNITAPPGAQETSVKTRGQIESGGDVTIGVIAPTAPSSAPRRKDVRP